MDDEPENTVNEALIERFESAWLDGDAVSIESFLRDTNSQCNLETLIELVLVDLEFNWRTTSSADVVDETYRKPQSVEQYLVRFPNLNSNEITKRLAEHEYDVRTLYGEKPQLAEYQERFPSVIIEATDLPSVEPTTPPEELETSSQIGRYKLLQEIGRGGFGVVYMAEQEEPVKRRVALKVIKAGMDTREVVARFEAERQALAMMDHPNIARVFDAGATEEGRPYFVMQLVEGIPITEYCDGNQLSIPERLRLFMDVCHAIQHAHQKGIIHRDIKPSNVLVGLYDGRAVPKVIDFGVAKATEQRLTEKTMFTQFGQIVGTPQYMSPEQAELNQLDIDTRSDVYSLGVLLYELLTGEPPISLEELRGIAFNEMLRIIREQEARSPSQKVSSSGPALSEISLQRQMEPHKLPSLIRGELDWIVMKALEKDRSRRYDSASAFGDDIRRHIEQEPVVAGPPSAVYRLQKLARKHRGLLIIGVLIATILICGAGISTWQAIVARIARDNAEKASLLEIEARHEADVARNEAEQLAAQNSDLAEQERRQRESAEERLYQAQIIQADSALSSGRIDDASLFLQQIALDQREWEARYLAKRIEGSFCTLSFDDEVHHVAYRPDGNAFLSVATSEVAIWNCTTGKKTATIAGDFLYAEFNNAGDRIVTGGRGSELHFWDAITQEKIQSHKLNGPIVGLTVSRANSLIATADESGDVRLWDFTTGLETHTGKTHNDVFAVAFSPSAKHLFTAANNGTVHLWEIAGDKPADDKPTTTFQTESSLNCFAVSPDGNHFATGGNVLTVWNANDGKRIFTKDEGTTIETLAFSSDGRKVFTGSGYAIGQSQSERTRLGSNRIRVRHVASGAELMTLFGHSSAVDSLAVSPDGLRLLSSSRLGRDVKLWNANRVLPSIPLGLGAVRALSISRDGSTLVAAVRNSKGKGGLDEIASTPGTLFVFDFSTWQLRTMLPLPQLSIGMTFALSPTGDRVAISQAYQVQIYDVETGTLSFELGQQPQSNSASTQLGPDPHLVNSLAFSPDGKIIATASYAHGVRLWNARTGELVHTIETDQTYLTFSPSGDRIATMQTGARGKESRDANVSLWDVATGKLVAKLPGVVYGDRIAFTPDGKRLITYGGFSETIVREISTGETLLRLNPDYQYVNDLAISPLENRLAHFLVGELSLLDASTGMQLLKLATGDKPHAAWSPTGERLVVGDASGNLQIYDARISAETMELSDEGIDFAAVLSNDGRYVISRTIDPFGDRATFKIWNSENGQLLLKLLAGNPQENRCDLSDDGLYAATAFTNSTVSVWSLVTGKNVHTLPTSGEIEHVAFSEDGKYVVAMDVESELIVWSLSTGERVTDNRYDTIKREISNRETKRFPRSFGNLRVHSGNSTKLHVTRTFETHDPWRVEATRRRAWDCFEHNRQAQRAESERNWFAAVFHLTRLLDTDHPFDEQEVRSRYETAKRLRDHN